MPWRLEPYGDAALRIAPTASSDAVDVAAVADLAEVLRERDIPGAVDVIGAAEAVVVTARDSSATDDVRAELQALLNGPLPVPSGGRIEPVIEVPMRFDGEDLQAVASSNDMSVETVVERHLASLFVVAFCGFAPGFAYMVSDEPLRVPRRATPRSRIPAGSVALADRYCGIYPTDSPGGWQTIGSTDIELFDLAEDPPALLAPRRRVRFVSSTDR